MLRTVLTLGAALLALGLGAPPATAGGGSYVFDGGTRGQRAQVAAALEASSFDWDVVPRTVVVHIERGTLSRALPGEVWLDARLLDAGMFAWGTVQHEFAHQVDFLALDAVARGRLAAALGGADWCYERPGLEHGEHGCERFASTLAWSYWPVPENSFRPGGGHDEPAAMAPDAFRALLASVLALPRLALPPKLSRPAAAPKRKRRP